ncbi:Oar protein [Blastomonas aquatica]|uniref:Oar protein n=2 Tax=Blastomonas aquatica TaxID=1510276 RepID=A0ABQ1IZG5_9SPHN|nr:Oar protein [Blastomonas aquatica]
MQIRYYLAASAAALSLATVMAAPAHAQETTSSVRGSVTGDGTPLAGAEVRVIHTPSGTVASTTTDAQGNFSTSGLRLGGPFTVEVNASGFEQSSVTDIFLQAGQAFRVPVALQSQSVIVVTASSVSAARDLDSGAGTVLTARDILGVANVNRDIRNLAARDPLVNLDPTNNSISIAGQNNRFNRFTVDGVAFGDPFGLEAGGLVSTRGPVPLDAIGEFSVEVAPVDIQQGFFQGGAINAQLKSGSNRFSFLGGALYQDQSLRGSRADDLTRTGSFESQIYTAQASGPIIKDKLFFAVTYERTRETVPADVQPSQLGITDAQIAQISGIAQSVYNFDTLGVADSIVESDDKLVTKLDWNVADGHRITATYIWNESRALAGQTGVGAINATSPTFFLLSNNYTLGSTNHFGIIQSNNQWSDNFSTQLRVSYADYVRLQEPVGGNRDFGEFLVCLDPTSVGIPTACSAGTRQLRFGPDFSRQANELDAQSLAVEFQATLNLNNHTVKLIAERRRQDIRNLFAQGVSGVFYFDSIADLEARNANQLSISTPLRGGLDTVAAEFQNNSWTFGIMDTIDLADNLTVVAGMRYDLFDTPDRPFANSDFLARYGFPNTSTLNGRSLFQPRFGVNWKPTDRLKIRGSAGIFGGGNPNVWISNNYSLPGPLLGTATVTRQANGTFTVGGLSGLSAPQVQALAAASLNGVSGGTGVPQQLLAGLQTGGASNARTNALDPNFNPISQWRVSGSVDYEADLGGLGDGWNFGADVIWSRVRDALEWTDLRSVANGTLPDGRPRYNLLPGVQASNNFDILLTNADRGYSWNAVARFSKRWGSGFFMNGAYTFSRVKDGNPGNSSVAFSNYTGSVNFDPNISAYGTSDFQRDNAVRFNFGFDNQLFGDNNTRFELFYNGRSGRRFSYTVTDPVANNNVRSNVFGVLGSNSRFLAYVPNVSSRTADPSVLYAANFDFDSFQRFVQNTKLNDFQGQIAPKNIASSPWFHKVDIAIRQELPLFFGGKVELSAEMENVLNFIDKDWGTLRQVGGSVSVANVTCLQTPGDAASTANLSQPCTQLLYSNNAGATFREPTIPTQLNGSLWGIRFGVRVKF